MFEFVTAKHTLQTYNIYIPLFPPGAHLDSVVVISFYKYMYIHIVRSWFWFCGSETGHQVGNAPKTRNIIRLGVIRSNFHHRPPSTSSPAS